MIAQIGESTLELKMGDITLEETDVIVNAANGTLLGGGGVDGAIHQAAGDRLKEACQKVRDEELKGEELPAGETVITEGFDLKADNVIHTVGPVWEGGDCNEDELLANSYRNALQLARVRKLESISFPSISTGAYGYPIDKAAEVALQTIINFLEDNIFGEVRMVLFTDEDLKVYQDTLQGILE